MSGVYCIKVDDAIVYVGKSKNINERISQHWSGVFAREENKYSLLYNALHRSHKITFWLLEECEVADLNKKETFWIQQLRPCLNSSHNGGVGKDLTAQEFYDVVYNQKDEVEGMYEYKYLRYERIGKQNRYRKITAKRSTKLGHVN